MEVEGEEGRSKLKKRGEKRTWPRLTQLCCEESWDMTVKMVVPDSPKAGEKGGGGGGGGSRLVDAIVLVVLLDGVAVCVSPALFLFRQLLCARVEAMRLKVLSEADAAESFPWRRESSMRLFFSEEK